MTGRDWGAADEELLGRLLAGDCGPDDPEVLDRLRAQPALREEYEELLGLADPLQAAGRGWREDLAAVEQLPVPPADRALAAAALAGVRPGARRGVSVWLLAAAAALVLAAAGLYLLQSTGGSPPDELLGGERHDLRPRGRVESVTRFEWRDDAFERGGLAYVVRVLDGEATTALHEIEVHALSCPVPAPLPPSFRWQVWRVEPDGGRRLLGETEVELR